MKNNPIAIKVSKMKFPLYIFGVCAGIFLLCLTSVVLSIWRIVKYGIQNPTEILSYPLLFVIAVFCIVITISLLIKSQYVINENELIVQYGFLKNKYDVKKITAISLDGDTKKLRIDLENGYILLSFLQEDAEAFSRVILQVNPKIEYKFTFPESNKK